MEFSVTEVIILIGSYGIKILVEIMAFLQVLLVLATTATAFGQRPFFAGSRPIGYPELITTTTESLGNRFGEDDVTTTTQRLPIEAGGDRELVDRLSKLPIDKQPFWLINWQALEANRNNPQTYPVRPSHFAQPFAPQAPNQDTLSNRFDTTTASTTTTTVPTTRVTNSGSLNPSQINSNGVAPVAENLGFRLDDLNNRKTNSDEAVKDRINSDNRNSGDKSGVLSLDSGSWHYDTQRPNLPATFNSASSITPNNDDTHNSDRSTTISNVNPSANVVFNQPPTNTNLNPAFPSNSYPGHSSSLSDFTVSDQQTKQRFGLSPRNNYFFNNPYQYQNAYDYDTGRTHTYDYDTYREIAHPGIIYYH